MKLFQATLEFYQICGINLPQPNKRLNCRIVLFLLIVFLFFISLVGTFLFKSTNFEDYIDSFCLLVTLVATLVNILECDWKRAKLFKFIEQWEELIEKRNSDY